VILLGMGQIVNGITVIVPGVLVIAPVDNVSCPPGDARRASRVRYLGFVIGSVIEAFLLVVWEMFAQEHADRTITWGERPSPEADESNAA
jgi:hypothetical protein